MDDKYQSVCEMFTDNSDITVHRGYSLDILSQFPDDYFDWVYIDGNHNFEVVSKDIALAYHKVKPTGMICGDDLFWEREDRMHVKEAVHGFQRANAATVSFSRFGAQYILQLDKNNREFS